MSSWYSLAGTRPSCPSAPPPPPAKCIAHRCYQQHVADNYESIPVLEPAEVEPDADRRYGLVLRFKDGSRLHVTPALEGGVVVEWEGVPQ